jgi:hypothetical protein
MTQQRQASSIGPATIGHQNFIIYQCSRGPTPARSRAATARRARAAGAFHRHCAAIALVALGALACAGPASAQNGLVAAYGFNEGAGSTTTDASGNANTGTLSGATWHAGGRYGGALAFDGINDWVTVPDKSVLDLTSGMTVEAWVYASSVGAWRTVLLKETTSGLSYGLYASNTSSRPSGWIRRTSDIDATGPSALSANTWVHLAATYNGSTLILYVNGAQVATKAITGAIVTSSGPLRIGGTAPWGEYFAGRIDEVRIYNRALSPSEIQTDMSTPVGSVTPPGPDFSVSASPASQTVSQGSSTTYTVTVGALNGFASPVSLSASGLPANASASFNPATLTGAGSSTMTVTTAFNTPVGSPTLTITGTSGALTRTATVGLAVNASPTPDFTVSAAPGSRSVTQGASTSYAVTIGAVNGFSGTVNLAVSGLPANATGSFSPATVAGSGPATLNITTTGTTPTGSPTLTVTGTSGALTRTTTVGLAVTSPPDFTISAAPGSSTVVQGGSTNYTVTIDALSGFSGTVNLSATGLPASASATFSPASITSAGSATLTVTTAAGTPSGTSSLTITGTSGSLNHSATANLSVSAASSGRAVGIHFVGTGTSMGASESAGVLPKSNWNNATGPSRTTALALVDETGGPSGAVVTWTSNSTWRTPITDQAGNPRLMRGYLDSSDTSVTTVTVAGLPNAAYDVYVYADGDNGSTARTAAYRISGAGITTTTINLTDTANTNFSSTFTQATNSAGNYVKFSIVASGFTLTATPGASTSSKRAPVNAVQIVPTAPSTPDFAISSTPGSRTVSQGSGTTYTVTTSALNGFADTVALAVTGLPANATATFTPASLVGSGTATLNVTTAADTPPGNSTLTITGTSGSLTHTTATALVVNATAMPDFAVSATPGTRSVTQGMWVRYTIDVTALNGFAGDVTLSATGLPADSYATFAPASLTGAGASTLTVTTTATTPTGTSTLTIAGTSGTLTRSAPVSLTVTGQTYTIGGTIAPAGDGAATAVALGGTAVATATADAAGAFNFAGLANGPYVVTPAKSGFTFSPANRNVSVSNGNVSGVDFTAAQSPNTISLSSPANGATVSSAFSMTATASASVVAVQFQVDGANAGPEDTSAPYAVSVTAPSGSHSLRAIGRDASGNTVTSASVSVTVSGGSGTALAINGSQTFQTMDGFGVNINSLSWKNGQLAPALDRLVDELGAKTWRVVFDMMDWESTNDNADPNTPDWAYYNALYSNAKFQNLWGTLRYLNQKGVTSGIALSFMGRVPAWMGGARITSTAAMEDEWVETVATLVYYARNTENVQFALLDPLNEPDWDGFEGPQVDQWQYPRLLQKLSVKLDAMGLSDVRFLGPNTAAIGTGVDTYLPELFRNSVAMSKLDHFGFHNYAGQTGGADARIKGSAYPQKNFWMTELSIPEQIFTMIGQGAAAAQIWDAYDSVYHHAILAGAFYNDGRGSTPPNDAGNLAALMSYNSSSGLYNARPQFYQMQTFKYVMPGSLRIGATESHSSLTVYAFRHPTTGRVTLVGRNIGGSSITLNGSLSGVGSIGALQFYQTSISNNYNSFNRGSDAVVTGGAFTVTVPSNSYFTLTSPGQ